jgi:hypothetical protein
MTKQEKTELNRLFTNLENSASQDGCSSDLTVVSQSALEQLAEAFGTWISLDDSTDGEEPFGRKS